MKVFLLSLLFLCSSAQAYQELKSYQDLQIPKTERKAWVIFDIDNTLIHPSGNIGSVEWVEYMKTRYIQAGFTPEAAAEKQHELFATTQSGHGVQLVDPSIRAFLKTLSKNTNVFALTARNRNSAHITTQQMSQVSLMGAMEINPPLLKQKPTEFHWERGILYASGQDKGKLLELMLANVDAEPEAIYFFDDKNYNVEAFDQAMARINEKRDKKIEFQSYFLTAADKWVKNFDSKKADREWYNYRYLNGDFSSQSMTQPLALATILLQQTIFAPNEHSCKVQSRNEDDVVVHCSYNYCAKWSNSYAYDDDYCVLPTAMESVSFQLRYLKDLDMYIRSGWEFFL